MAEPVGARLDFTCTKYLSAGTSLFGVRVIARILLAAPEMCIRDSSLDTLINPDVSPDDEGANQMKMLYCSCPSEMRDTLLHHTQETEKELCKDLLQTKEQVSDTNSSEITIIPA